MNITPRRLMEVLSYAPETGEFVWIKSSKGTGVGDKAGTMLNGRIAINVDGRRYLAHRLAWLYVYGEAPGKFIDHIDGNPANNRISNLRLCSQSENLQNQRRAKANSRSGFLGVSWRKQTKKWRAVICIGRKAKELGHFDSPEEAHAAYVAAKRIYHPFCSI